MFKYFKLSLNYILPKKWLTQFAGYIANKHWGLFTKILIDIFIWVYKVNMVEVSKSNTANYNTFNDFFIRLLKEDARPIDNNSSIISIPADGTISQLGCIKGDQIFQAKGHFYSLQALLAGDSHLAAQFLNGKFITIYLSPRDYHRVHMPCNGILCEMIYVPGKLYSLNSFNIHNVPNLFALNERLICVFNTDYGLMVQILVGAIIVSSIETVWSGNIKWSHNGTIKRWQYSNDNHPIILFKGQEMGHFKLGSTVINLFISNRVKLLENLKIKSKTRVGQPLAIALPKQIQY